MIEFRIYYESLEQAHHYIQPLVSSVTGATVKLVKRVKNANKFGEGSLRALHLLTTPDALITGVVDGFEVPLVVIEFTEAVSTEDHELQRTNGAVAAYLAKTFYLKVSSNKLSSDEFGSAPYDPYITPKIFLDEFGYEGYVIAEWDTGKNNALRLQRSEGLFGCPPDIPMLTDTIQSAVKGFSRDASNWFTEALLELKQTDSYALFLSKRNAASSLSELLKVWEGRESRNKQLDRLRFHVREKQIGIKIYRFAHAMDPDRGIISFVSFLLSNTRQIFGIYSLVRKRPPLKGSFSDVDEMKGRLVFALNKDKLDSGSIPDWLQLEIEANGMKARVLGEQINFQEVWERNRDLIEKNKVVMTLAYFTDGLFLNHNGAVLTWNRHALLGGREGDNFHDLLARRFGFDKTSKPMPTVEVTNGVDEDEVTYAIAHRVLMPNSFRIVSISYPGSQGGNAVLPDKTSGKTQKREYPDVVALPPEGATGFDALLNESKGKFNKTELTKTVEKLDRYLSNDEYREALKMSLVVAEVMTPDYKLEKILIGVGFGVTSRTNTVWQPDAVDFIFRIVDRQRWSIGIFRQELADLIPIIEGDTNFPKCYSLVEP